MRRNKDPYATQGTRRSRQPFKDTTSVFHTVSLMCQRAMANTGQHRVQFQTVPAKRGESGKKSPFCSIYYHACYPEPDQGTKACPLVIFQNFTCAVLTPQDRHTGDVISSTTILAVKGHAPAHGREPVSGSHVGRSASGQGLKLLFWHLDNGREIIRNLVRKNTHL